MRFLRHVAVALMAAAFAGPALAADDVVIAKFKALEEAWSNALKAQDRATLDRFLSADYTLTVAIEGRLIQVDRESWLTNATSTYVVHEFEFQELVVREYGDTAVVSSRYTQEATVNGRDLSDEFFLTDIWIRSGDTWKVSARYSSRPESLGSAPPK